MTQEEKERRFELLVGLKDKQRDKIINIAIEEDIGAYARNIIPMFRETYPLNDLIIIELGEINSYTGEIKQKKEEIKLTEWQKAYNFKIAKEEQKKGE